MAAAEYIQRGKPLREQEKWADIRPCNLPEVSDLVAIKISPEDEEIFQYFLAVAGSGQKDKRALAITEAVIGINSASYHAWSFRWECLLSTCSKRELKDERAFLERVAAVNVKNYQLWNYRRRLAIKLGPNSAEEAGRKLPKIRRVTRPHQKPRKRTPHFQLSLEQQELDFAAQCLTDDPKNYHAWAHRQAVVERFGLWQEELLFTAQMIQDDVRNNSAWNQRFFIVSKAKLHSPEEVVQRELEFAAQAILKAPHNDSPWIYIRALAGLQQDTLFLACNSQLHSISQHLKTSQEVSSRDLMASGGRVMYRVVNRKRDVGLQTSLHTVCSVLKDGTRSKHGGLIESQRTLLLHPGIFLHCARGCKSKEVLEDLPSCSPALSLLADIYVAQMRECVRRKDTHAAQTIANLAFQCFESLQTADPIRRHYWRFRSEQVKSVVRAS